MNFEFKFVQEKQMDGSALTNAARNVLIVALRTRIEMDSIHRAELLAQFCC